VKMMRPVPVWLWLLIAVILVLGVCHAPARAHDHSRPELNGWFQSLRSRKGICCDGDEALHLRDIEWETQEKDGSHYRVRIPIDGGAYQRALQHPNDAINTMWVDVPDDAVIDEPNRAGVALVWPVYSALGASIRCFMPGQMG
jgi:hypothetical protein